MNSLAKLPRERWAEQDEDGRTFVHYVCRGPNVAALVALVQSGLVDVNARTKWGWTPAMYATWTEQPRVLEVLCAAGADLRACNNGGYAPIDYALSFASMDGGETVRVLVANGVRLSAVRDTYRPRITPKLWAFERGVLRCRAAAVALLRVKKAAKLHHVDKFLMRELAYATWSTRTSERWQE